jgi:hypothetical protein
MALDESECKQVIPELISSSKTIDHAKSHAFAAWLFPVPDC